MSYIKLVEDNINSKLMNLALKHDISINDLTVRYHNRLTKINHYNSFQGHESKAMFLAYKLTKDYVEHNYEHMD